MLPGVERLVLDERTGRALGIAVEGATLRVGERLRLVWSGEEVRVPSGDLEVKHGWLWLDLAARTETRAPEVVRDGEGRPFLRTDALGRPVRNVDGSYEFERAEHWLCLEAGGRRMELALPLVP